MSTWQSTWMRCQWRTRRCSWGAGGGALVGVLPCVCARGGLVPICS